ncbi:hypothetical protein LCGC14_3140770, partial [marine sediment metagenome]
MKLKRDVRLHGIRPELVVAMVIADRVYVDHEQEMIGT